MPIQQLARDVEFKWGQVQDKAFEEVKMLLSKVLVLAHYDPKEELVLQCDASNNGLQMESGSGQSI